jgi:hypothetical protein
MNFASTSQLAQSTGGCFPGSGLTTSSQGFGYGASMIGAGGVSGDNGDIARRQFVKAKRAKPPTMQ